MDEEGALQIEPSFAEDVALRRILEGTASATGEEFFRALVQNLGSAMGVYAAFITEYLPETRSARAVAFWSEDGWVDDYQYTIPGTPCEGVFEEGRFFHFPDRLPELFPKDPDLEGLGLISYMGEPLKGIDDRVLGHLCVMDRKPLPDEARCLALFRIFAARAAAERKRMDAENALREREEKLARLVRGAMDAIIELDSELRVTQFSAAAADTFGCRTEHVLGTSFTGLIAPESEAVFARLAAELSREDSDQRAAWIRKGFFARRGDGTVFPAEMSLSSSRTERGTFFTVVLRNVEDRVRAAARIQALSAETAHLRAELETLRGPGEIIGESPAIRKVLQAIAQVAPADSTVLLSGETGTGKEVIARTIHAASRRAGGPLVRVNCGAVPANLIESGFFGHEKGAFTGATARREGRFQLADGGTIFLDEIGELPLELQPKLLRVLQEGEFEPVGSSRSVKVDVRVIAATNRDLENEVREGRFRQDLFYRLNVFPIAIPPLRERSGDVALLAETFCRRLSKEMGRPFEGLTEHCRELLMSYRWPGNVRELQNVIERALLCTPAGGPLDLAAALPSSAPSTNQPALPDTASDEPGGILTDAELRRFERSNMLRALEQCDWRISGTDGAAALLGLKPSTCASRMKAFGISKARS